MDPMRRVIIDGLEEAKRWHHVPVFFQADVTALLETLSDMKSSGQPAPTLTTLIIRAFAASIDRNRHMQAIRVGDRLHIYDDVDVATIIEKTSELGESVPTMAILRRVNRRDVADIGRELQAARAAPGDRTLVGSEKAMARSNFLARMPRFIRRLAMWYLRRRPGLRKETMGTVLVSSVGMLSTGLDRLWAVPPAPWPLSLSVLSTFTELRPGTNGVPRECQICNMTLLFDHDIADAYHAAKLIADFKASLERPDFEAVLRP